MNLILGHRRQRDLLLRAAALGRPHHAYLFVGPSGVGKSLVARDLALALNCAERTGEPCGHCRSCRTIAAVPSLHPDVWTVGLEERDPNDAAKGVRDVISIDQVREVQRRVTYRLGEARYRVVVLDPADRLHPSAANAFLKTLEEPPPATVFVLIAPSASALLPTIRSRCQQVSFGALPDEEVVPWLVSRGIPEPEARLRTRLAEGRPGRALLWTAEQLQHRRELLEQWLGALDADDRARIAFAESVGGQKDDLLLFFSAAQALLRDAVVRDVGAAPPVHADCPDLIESLGRRWSTADTLAELSRLGTLRARLRVHASPRGLLEEWLFDAPPAGPVPSLVDGAAQAAPGSAC